jgi:hypothetical protein
VIVRGQEFVVISPGTRIRVPEASSPNKIMQLIEDWGSALFRIEKKSTPHFGVQTPYLAAVVKGTTFTVTVGPENAKVKVTEGAVEVSTLDGGATELVRPGSLATVGKSDLYRLTVEGSGAKELRSGAAPVAGVVTIKSPNEASVAKGDNRSARAETVRIAKAIGEKPTSLAKLTGGLVEGASAAEHAQGQFNENSRNARGPKPDNGGGKPGTDGNPGEGDKPSKGDKPAKDEKPAGEEKPGDGTKPGATPGDGEDKPGGTNKGEEGKPGGGSGNGSGGEDADAGSGKGDPGKEKPGSGADEDDGGAGKGKPGEGEQPGKSKPGDDVGDDNGGKSKPGDDVGDDNGGKSKPGDDASDDEGGKSKPGDVSDDDGGKSKPGDNDGEGEDDDQDGKDD